MAKLNIFNNVYSMLVLSSLIFAASFWTALWLDGRMRLKTKGQSWLERDRRAFLQIGTDLPRELLKLWKALSVAWMMFAVWRMLSSCVAGPDGWQRLDTRNPSCAMGGRAADFGSFMRFSGGRPHCWDSNPAGA